MSARSAMIRISKPERTSWFAEDSTERSDYQRTAAATPVRFAWWKIRSKESTALRAARSEPSSTRAVNSNAVINVCLLASFATLDVRSMNQKKSIEALQDEKESLTKSNKSIRKTSWDWKQ
ncbi:hypothetical protein JHK87_027597 [Glycine soja]|nr:hypothetical protein JHK87_027597 [Glycine soja]